jgi:hypothetical protein
MKIITLRFFSVNYGGGIVTKPQISLVEVPPLVHVQVQLFLVSVHVLVSMHEIHSETETSPPLTLFIWKSLR